MPIIFPEWVNARSLLSISRLLISSIIATKIHFKVGNSSIFLSFSEVVFDNRFATVGFE